ncbi:HAUS augmin-like complex subunit 4 isoform X1 [Watersipora subatra]|uniref:HAUS augmin-like complex subunit 4 isoform X1 n=1 Tax=Watersipora subatra TaxID=2589382 RepID=UPI00355C247C
MEELLQKNQTFLEELSKKIKYKHKIEKLRCEELERVKHKWYAAKVVYEAVQDLSDESTLSTNESSTDCIHNLSDRLALAQCEELVEVSSAGSQSGLLGIPSLPSEIASSEPNKSDMQLINDQIHKKLLAITQFYQPSPMGTGSTLANAKALQLHRMVAKDKETIEENKQQLEKLKQQKTLMLQRLQQVNSQNLHLFKTLLVEHSLKSLPDDTAQTTEYLSAKADALTTKIGLIEKELYSETYTPQIIKELSMIRQHLHAKLASVQEELNFTKNEYEKCLSAGSEFEKMAKEYSKLRSDIEKTNWALDELKAAKQHKT